MAKLILFAGSTRKGSMNQKLIQVAAKVARDKGAEVTLVDLKDFEMPLYNGDDEAEHGLPEKAKQLKQLFIEHDGFLIASPEYNSCISPLVKNTLDWISRSEGEGDPACRAFKGKVAGLISASPGALGGLKGLAALRLMLSYIGTLVIPTQLSVSHGLEAFHEDGSLTNTKQLALLERVLAQLIDTTRKLHA